MYPEFYYKIKRRYCGNHGYVGNDSIRTLTVSSLGGAKVTSIGELAFPSAASLRR
ncbi:MAG: hypothetical protein ACLUFM_02480 [Lachnospiraceae bacterium]